MFYERKKNIKFTKKRINGVYNTLAEYFRKKKEFLRKQKRTKMALKSLESDCPICLDLMIDKKNIKNYFKYFKYFNCFKCFKCFNLEDDNRPVQLDNCNHVFHKECIDEWKQMSPQCPLCRRNFKEYYKII